MCYNLSRKVDGDSMNNLDENICVVLEVEYQKFFSLPNNWSKIEDYHIKAELIGLAMAQKTKIENLEEYQKLAGETNECNKNN